MKRAYYSATLSDFVSADPLSIRDRLAGESAASGLPALEPQLQAWQEEVAFLQAILQDQSGQIYLEYMIPRMGRRADVVLLLADVIFVLEFKVGERRFTRAAADQVWDYALDLKNFHTTSHHEYVVPILIITRGKAAELDSVRFGEDMSCPPLRAGLEDLAALLKAVLRATGGGRIDPPKWEAGRYQPTPTIIEAAIALYRTHSVEDIARSDAEAANLAKTAGVLEEIIRSSKADGRKSICFVTGVPGAGKTLVGLNTATRFMGESGDLHAVYLSGNGPLVKVLCEALARDKVRRSKEQGESVTRSA